MTLGAQLKIIIPIVALAVNYTCMELGSQRDRIIFMDDDYLTNRADTRTDNAGKDACTTASGGSGQCVAIHDCPALRAMVRERGYSKLLADLRCEWDRDMPMVCCVESPTNVSTSYTPAAAATFAGGACEISSAAPEPASRCCGQGSATDRIIPGEIAAIDQYPWTALIEYSRNGLIDVKCGGTLISGRYVITAAHCLVSVGFLLDWTPENVRFGDYDIDNSGLDCVEVAGDGSMDCAPPALVIPIEKIIPHPDYDRRSKLRANDIGLIKLRDSAPYTDFIQPICLPTSDLKETENRRRLYVAGWGLPQDARSGSHPKRQAQLSMVNPEDCFAIYRRMHITLQEGQICAVGDKVHDPCKGDSGGGLMLVHSNRTELVAVASFGFSMCGLNIKPSVYTNVHYYLPWIRNIIN